MSPAGDRLVLMQRATGIVSMTLGRENAPEVIVPGPSSKWPSAWSADGRFVAFADTTLSGWRIWTTTARAGGTAKVYREAPFTVTNLEFSPDGRHVAYMSDESGRYEVYVDSYPDAANRIRASIDGGGWAKWRNDGRELFFLAPDRKLMAVSVTTTPNGLTLSTPHALFEGPGVNPDNTRTQFVPTADGSRFLFNSRVEDPTPMGITVITNWTTLLKK
jgi:Tol biopolymer transport system component